MFNHIRWKRYKNPVANTEAGAIFDAVSILKRTIALTFLALWLPVSMHCSLETIPGFNLLDLCCDTASPEPAKDDCSQDNCAEIEAGLYRVEDNPAFTLKLPIVLAMTSLVQAVQLPKPSPAVFLSTDSFPPELAQTWQFSLRTALPARAPSFIS